jgi:hypothetical protein
MKWLNNEVGWFNLDDFCHIWIETHKKREPLRYGPLETDYIVQDVILGYYAMGEWRHNGEEVIITQDWDDRQQLVHFLNEKLDVSGTWHRVGC